MWSAPQVGATASRPACAQCRVLATDPSQKQLDQAVQAPAGNITYQQGSAETIDLPDGAADLITVAAGLHWFDHEVHARCCSDGKQRQP